VYSLNKQRGFTNLYALLLALGVMSLLVVSYQSMNASSSIESDAKSFQRYLLYVKTQINAYEADRIMILGNAASPTGSNTLPAAWSDLSPPYLPACSFADASAGRCRLVDITPWGFNMSLSRQLIPGTANMRIVITVPFPALNAATRSMHQIYRAALAEIPGWTFDSGSGTATLFIERSGQSFQSASLVKRSGDDSTLTGDWDVGGNFSIVNARDITIRGGAGTQRSLGSGVVSSQVVRHGDVVYRPDCPSGFTPDIVTSIKGVYSTNGVTFGEVSSSRSYHTDGPNYWVIGLDYYAKVNGNWALLHGGEVNVIINCI